MDAIFFLTGLESINSTDMHNRFAPDAPLNSWYKQARYLADERGRVPYISEAWMSYFFSPESINSTRLCRLLMARDD